MAKSRPCRSPDWPSSLVDVLGLILAKSGFQTTSGHSTGMAFARDELSGSTAVPAEVGAGKAQTSSISARTRCCRRAAHSSAGPAARSGGLEQCCVREPGRCSLDRQLMTAPGASRGLAASCRPIGATCSKRPSSLMGEITMLEMAASLSGTLPTWARQRSSSWAASPTQRGLVSI